MTNTAAATHRTTSNVDVLMGDVVLTRGGYHVVIDEPVYVTSRGQRMIRWTLRPEQAGRHTGVVNGIWDVFPNGFTSVVVR
jgi:hypothetical protein